MFLFSNHYYLIYNQNNNNIIIPKICFILKMMVWWCYRDDNIDPFVSCIDVFNDDIWLLSKIFQYSALQWVPAPDFLFIFEKYVHKKSVFTEFLVRNDHIIQNIHTLKKILLCGFFIYIFCTYWWYQMFHITYNIHSKIR